MTSSIFEKRIPQFGLGLLPPLLLLTACKSEPRGSCSPFGFPLFLLNVYNINTKSLLK